MKRIPLLVLFLFLTVVGAVPATASTEAGWSGRLVDVGPLPPDLWLPGTGKAYRVRYTSTYSRGGTTVVSGAIFTPAGTPPAEGWPVAAWAHGTVGLADVCAPSTAGRSERDINYLKGWLAAGYAIVATDYEGLGTPGPHPYLNGTAAAHDVIDIVRASHQVHADLGSRWLVVGQSQGAQAAMFTRSLVDSYAPGLDFRGTVATGLPSQWRTTSEVAHAFDPAAPARVEPLLIAAGLSVTHPVEVNTDDLLTPLGRDILAKTRTTWCYDEIEDAIAGKTNGDVFTYSAAQKEELLTLLDRDAEIPITKYAGPVFIGQGTADTVVYPLATQTTAQKLAAAGTNVDFRFYPGADHDTTLATALPDIIAWARARTS
ncbi:lipase family protein [Kibdelosporangium philippinense]|uniref:Lipase family protein n=1 Tax=Kibdelosporangium philippinense TaxID=211113 RepID=A0ABS8ZCP2_9PSEU|nr:lipase family protein [Kibdelosporangium philippinense]MCE7004451.1 lipase family protein [Kibdelosporangium philippinense]